MIKIVIGIAIIVVSFVYLMKNHNQSLMDALMGKRRKQMEELMVGEPQEESSDSQEDSTLH